MRQIQDPRSIEKESLKIIHRLLAKRELTKDAAEVIPWVVHTTGDLNLANEVVASKGAIAAGIEGIRAGKEVIVDVNMVKAGIKEDILRDFGGRVRCFIGENKIAQEAKKEQRTRASLGMKFALQSFDGGVIVVGNAPTALFEVCRQISKGEIKPALVIGTPVGFVGAKEAKEDLMGLSVPYVVVRGTRGGSPIAVSIFNALLRMVQNKSKFQ